MFGMNAAAVGRQIPKSWRESQLATASQGLERSNQGRFSLLLTAVEMGRFRMDVDEVDQDLL